MRWRKLKWVGVAVLGVAGFVYLNNSSLLATPRQGRPVLVAHRGMAQDFDRTNLTGETCTAAVMLPPTHEYLENTIPSMAAAFEAGADIVEFDVHPTTDGAFAVIHDWTVDCRTEGSGVTREHELAELQALDIGHGYTADGGQTFPFRGQGVGLMPSLDQVLSAFPDRRFIINVKSNDPAEGAALAERLAQLPAEQLGRLMSYGGSAPMAELRARLPGLRTLSRETLQHCLLSYAGLGWTGFVPDACARQLLMVPANIAPWLWGWPDRFLDRMDRVGTVVLVTGTWRGGDFSTGIDTPEDFSELPAGFTGGIWTNRIDRIGPLLKPQ